MAEIRSHGYRFAGFRQFSSPGGAPERIDTGFTLNLQDDIPDFDPTRDYYVYARIDDGVNPPVYVYADGAISTVASVPGGGGTGGTGGTGGGIVVTGDLQNPLDYLKLSNDGRVFNLATRRRSPASSRLPAQWTWK